MKFDLTTPCNECPFRNDGHPFGLAEERVWEILGGNDDHPWPTPSFACHKTCAYDNSGNGRSHYKTQQCAGVMIILTREDRFNDIMQVAERLGVWRRSDLDMSAPVYASAAEAARIIPGPYARSRNVLRRAAKVLRSTARDG